MGSVLECLRHCLPPQEGSNSAYRSPQSLPSAQLMARSGSRIAPSSLTTTTTTTSFDENTTEDDDYSGDEGQRHVGGCCDAGETRISPADNNRQETSPLANFWQKLSKWGGSNGDYETLEARYAPMPDADAAGSPSRSSLVEESSGFDSSPLYSRLPFGLFRRASSNSPRHVTEETNCSDSSPCLRAASDFDATKDIPSIALDEVVLPGSNLQHIMAKKMSENMEDQGDECVICMEGFDETNPRMPTLCGCGENKTYFHLPCLYQWIDQSRDCPSCRKRLRWEEF